MALRSAYESWRRECSGQKFEEDRSAQIAGKHENAQPRLGIFTVYPPSSYGAMRSVMVSLW